MGIMTPEHAATPPPHWPAYVPSRVPPATRLELVLEVAYSDPAAAVEGVLLDVTL